MEERVLSLAFFFFSVFRCDNRSLHSSSVWIQSFGVDEFQSTLNKLESLCTNDRRQVGRVTDKTQVKFLSFSLLRRAVCHNADLLISNFI